MDTEATPERIALAAQIAALEGIKVALEHIARHLDGLRIEVKRLADQQGHAGEKDR